MGFRYHSHNISLEGARFSDLGQLFACAKFRAHRRRSKTQKGTPLRVAGGLLNFDKDGKAADEAIHKTRFPCHEPGSSRLPLHLLRTLIRRGKTFHV